MKKFNRKLLTAAVLATLPLTASALDIVDLEKAADFNLVVFEDYVAPSYSSFTHGVAIGGDMLLNDYGFAVEVPGDKPTVSAYVAGDFGFNQGRIFGGSVLVGGSAQGVATSVTNTLSDQQLVVDNVDVGIDFPNWKTNLQAKSLAYSQLAPTGTSVFKWGSTYELTGDCVSDLQVFNLEGASLSQTRDLRLNCVPQGAAVLFNVSGAQSGISYVSTNSLLPYEGKTLFNFYEASQLTFRYTEIHASILAPNANVVEATGELYGTAVANSWTGPMTLKRAYFQGYNAGESDCEGPVTN